MAMISYCTFEELLKENGVNATAVSKETGVARSVLTDWKKGRYQPKLETLQKLADYFKVDVKRFFDTGQEEDDEYKYIYVFTSDENPGVKMEIKMKDPYEYKDELQDLFDFFLRLGKKRKKKKEKTIYQKIRF